MLQLSQNTMGLSSDPSPSSHTQQKPSSSSPHATAVPVASDSKCTCATSHDEEEEEAAEAAEAAVAEEEAEEEEAAAAAAAVAVCESDEAAGAAAAGSTVAAGDDIEGGRACRQIPVVVELRETREEWTEHTSGERPAATVGQCLLQTSLDVTLLALLQLAFPCALDSIALALLYTWCLRERSQRAGLCDTGCDSVRAHTLTRERSKRRNNGL